MRVKLAALGDDMAALNLLLGLHSKGEGPSLVGRELALELADGAFAPAVVEHLPWVANDLSDALSRRADPQRRGLGYFRLHFGGSRALK